MSILSNPALQDRQEIERNEEWSNFMQRVGNVSNLVKDLASGDRATSDAAQMLADKYLNGKIITDENMELTVKSDRTVINQKAFKALGEENSNEMSKEAFMSEMGKDADRRALDRKIRRERADTLKTRAEKAFRRGEYDKALSCYNKAIDEVKDNPTFYCDRALTNIKLGNYQKIREDCDKALRLNENSFKARLYSAKAYKELEEFDKYEEALAELHEKFPQHLDLIEFFLEKTERHDVSENDDDDDDESEKTIIFT